MIPHESVITRTILRGKIMRNLRTNLAALSQIAISEILRVDVLKNRVSLTLNPHEIMLAFDNHLCAESFASLINAYAMLSPRPDRFFALCFKGTFVK